MATRVQKEKPFNIETMKGFTTIAEAVKYFSQVKQPVRQLKIVNLFNEAHELNIGNVSLNMAIFKSDTKQLETFIKRTGIFRSEKSVERVKKAVEAWQGIKPREPFDGVVKDPLNVVKAQTATETPTE